MSAKKGAPALYELYYSGKSTTRKGFFGRKRKNMAYGDVKDIPMAKPEKPQSPIYANVPQSGLSDSGNSEVYDDAGPAICAEGRVNVSMPYWLFAMMIAAIVMSVLAAYRLGSVSPRIAQVEPVASDTLPISDVIKESDNTTPPSAEMQAALQSDAYPGLITGTVASDNTFGSDIDNDIIVRPARCLIVLGHSNPDDLVIIRDYFVKTGLQLDIAKRGREYVLVTREGFVSTKEEICQELSEKIREIGKSYIVNRPIGGLRILLATFNNPYPIDTNKLNFDIGY